MFRDERRSGSMACATFRLGNQRHFAANNAAFGTGGWLNENNNKKKSPDATPPLTSFDLFPIEPQIT